MGFRRRPGTDAPSYSLDACCTQDDHTSPLVMIPGYEIATTEVRLHPDLFVWLAAATPLRAMAQTEPSPTIHGGGKGTSAKSARLGAVAEVVERYASTYSGTENVVRSTHADLPNAISPDTLQLFSEHQHRHRAELNPYYRGSCDVPPPFDVTVPVLWSPILSVTNATTHYMPTALAYFGVPQPDGYDFFRASSNGCAAGLSIEDATLRALLEVIERDAVACWWYSRAARPEIRIEDDWVCSVRIRDALRDLGREVWILDVSHDVRVPVAVAVSRRNRGHGEELTLGFGSELTVRRAVERALCELVQLLPEATTSKARTVAGALHPNPSVTYWWRTASSTKLSYLLPDPQAVRVCAEEIADQCSSTQALCILSERLRRLGNETLAIDQSRPGVILKVVKVIVPGFRSLKPAFGIGRLFDVPLELGWLTRRLREHELNPTPIPT